MYLHLLILNLILVTLASFTVFIIYDLNQSHNLMSFMHIQVSAQDDQSPWQSTPGFPQTQGPPRDGQSSGQSTPGFPPTQGPDQDAQSPGQSGGQFDFPPIGDQDGGEEESGVQLNQECNELEIKNATASGFESDPADYHPPSDAIDGDSSTWWSNNGKDPWLEIDLGESHSICSVSIEWNKGDSREYTFEIEVSEDGNDYAKVFEGNNNKGSTEPETYAFEQEANGQFIRLTTTDTSSGDGWVSVQELEVLGMPLQ